MSNLIGAVIAIAFSFAFAWGWVLNIIELSQSTFAPVTGEVVLRVIGVFMAPLGAVMGYI